MSDGRKASMRNTGRPFCIALSLSVSSLCLCLCPETVSVSISVSVSASVCLCASVSHVTIWFEGRMLADDAIELQVDGRTAVAHALLHVTDSNVIKR